MENQEGEIAPPCAAGASRRVSEGRGHRAQSLTRKSAAGDTSTGLRLQGADLTSQEGPRFCQVGSKLSCEGACSPLCSCSVSVQDNPQDRQETRAERAEQSRHGACGCSFPSRERRALRFVAPDSVTELQSVLDSARKKSCF